MLSKKRRIKLNCREAELLFPKAIRHRDQDAIQAIKKCNHGKCEHCNERKINHSHHITTVGSGGDDTVQNLIGLCWVCHTKAHAGNISKEKQREIVAARNRMMREQPYWNELLRRGMEK
jgi:5-methylcytosine-specific restriction endonuclease McrA